MRISVIIPTYKTSVEYLCSAILSALTQDFKDYELIISDDCSPCFQVERVENFIKGNNPKNIPVSIIVNKENLGTVKNLNQAFLKCCGEIIVGLSSDDCFYDEQVLKKISEKFEDLHVNIISCRREECDENLHATGKLIPNDTQIKRINKVFRSSKDMYYSLGKGMSHNFASGSSLYFRKSFFLDNNMFDEKYRLWEDGPFLSKVTRKGYKISLCFDIIAIKYRSGGISSKKSGVNPIIQKDYVRFYQDEYLSRNISFVNREIILGRLTFIKNNNRHTLKSILSHPLYYLSLIHYKIWK